MKNWFQTFTHSRSVHVHVHACASQSICSLKSAEPRWDFFHIGTVAIIYSPFSHWHICGHKVNKLQTEAERAGSRRKDPSACRKLVDTLVPLWSVSGQDGAQDVKTRSSELAWTVFCSFTGQRYGAPADSVERMAGGFQWVELHTVWLTDCRVEYSKDIWT